MAGFKESSLVFYLGVHTIRGNGTQAAAHLRRDPMCGLAVVEEREEQNFHQPPASHQVLGENCSNTIAKRH